MAKIYESMPASFGIAAESGRHVQFKAFETKSGARIGYLDTTDKNVQQVSMLDEAGLEALVESTVAFRNGVPGQRGVWLREQRVQAETAAGVAEQLQNLRGLTADDLRTMIAKAGQPVPQTDDINTLAAAALAAGIGGQLAKPVPPQGGTEDKGGIERGVGSLATAKGGKKAK